MSVILGIDPGGKSTGIVVRCGAGLYDHRIVTAVGPATGMPSFDYLRRIEAAVTALIEDHQPDVYALESVTPPRGFKNGRRDPIQPGSLIGLSVVAGYLMALLPDPTLVPPAGNGSRPLATYPTLLVGAREKTGGGILRHARSAWDVAGAAL